MSFVKGNKQGWPKGVSGNPGGRPAITKVCKEAGFEADELRAEVIQRLVKGMRELDPGDKDAAASWRHCTQTLHFWLNGKPTEHVQIDDKRELTEEEYNASLAAIVQEQIAKMSPDERLKLLTGQEMVQ